MSEPSSPRTSTAPAPCRPYAPALSCASPVVEVPRDLAVGEVAEAHPRRLDVGVHDAGAGDRHAGHARGGPAPTAPRAWPRRPHGPAACRARACRGRRPCRPPRPAGRPGRRRRGPWRGRGGPPGRPVPRRGGASRPRGRGGRRGPGPGAGAGRAGGARPRPAPTSATRDHRARPSSGRGVSWSRVSSQPWGSVHLLRWRGVARAGCGAPPRRRGPRGRRCRAGRRAGRARRPGCSARRSAPPTGKPCRYQPVCLRISRRPTSSPYHWTIRRACSAIRSATSPRVGGAGTGRPSKAASRSRNSQGRPRQPRPTTTPAQPVSATIRSASAASQMSPLPSTGTSSGLDEPGDVGPVRRRAVALLGGPGVQRHGRWPRGRRRRGPPRGRSGARRRCPSRSLTVTGTVAGVAHGRVDDAARTAGSATAAPPRRRGG